MTKKSEDSQRAQCAEPTSAEHADYAKKALDAFYSVVGTDEEHLLVGDLLGDLMHYCRKQNIDFNAVLRRGQQHFQEEVFEECGVKEYAYDVRLSAVIRVRASGYQEARQKIRELQAVSIDDLSEHDCVLTEFSVNHIMGAAFEIDGIPQGQKKEGE